MVAIPAEYHDLFERRTFAHFATLTPEGAPHVTPVWIDYDVETNRVLINTERGRRKEQNVRHTPQVGLSMLDPDDPYRRLSVIGEVTEVTTEGARDHIEALSQRYVDGPYPGEIRTERIILRIKPTEVF